MLMGVWWRLMEGWLIEGVNMGSNCGKNVRSR